MFFTYSYTWLTALIGHDGTTAASWHARMGHVSDDVIHMLGNKVPFHITAQLVLHNAQYVPC